MIMDVYTHRMFLLLFFFLARSIYFGLKATELMLLNGAEQLNSLIECVYKHIQHVDVKNLSLKIYFLV